MYKFKLVSDYKPSGDQPVAIRELTEGIKNAQKFQTLLGVTGSGKTYTMAQIIQNINKPALVISHNKTLAAQLYGEFKQLFPDNIVEFFISYYDYYQPEAYIPQTDTYIEKDASINEQIEKLRLSTTSSLLSRRDVVVVASVSCIYGLGSPEDYFEMMALITVGSQMDREDLLRKIAEDTRLMQSIFTTGSGPVPVISLTGLGGRVKSRPTGPLEVEMYIPYSIVLGSAQPQR